MSDKQQGEIPPTSATIRTKAAAEESKRELDAATAGGSDVDALGEQIEQTRADMAETIDAIQDKLDPRTLKQQALDAARAATVGRVEPVISAADENMHRVVQTLGERTATIKEGASQQAQRVVSRTTTIKEGAALQAQRVVSKVRTVREPGAGGGLSDQAPSSVLADEHGPSGSWGNKAAEVGRAARRARQELETQVRRHPLAGCLLALALGTVLGRAVRPSANGHDQLEDIQAVPSASPAITVAEAYPEV